MEANVCQLCGEIWNAVNLTVINIKDKRLNLCPECMEAFTEEYVAKTTHAEPEVIQ